MPFNDPPAMPRLSATLTALALLVLAGGCVTQLHPGAPGADYYHARVDRDVARYVDRLDRELRLDRDQEARIARLLESRTRHLLEHTRPSSYPYVYPFPRGERRGSRSVQRDWWRDADRHIMRRLTRRQSDDYLDLVRSGRLQYGWERDGERDRRRDRGARRPTRRYR